MDNVKPRLEVKGPPVLVVPTYQVPLEVLLIAKFLWLFAGLWRWQMLARECPWKTHWQMKFQKLLKDMAALFANGMICTEWPRPTKHSPTSAGKSHPFEKIRPDLFWRGVFIKFIFFSCRNKRHT
jgi:hypothetical protein